MHRKVLGASLLMVSLSVQAADAPPLDSAPRQASYWMGYSSGVQIMQQFGPVADPDAVRAGLADALAGTKPRVNQADLQPAFQQVRELLEKKTSERMSVNKAEGDKFRQQNSARPGVTTTASGLQYEVLKAGSGAKPTATQRVKTHYHGQLIDGAVFDSSVERGEPVTFPVTGVIKGWVEALQMMPVGSKWRLVLPPELAYGEKGAPPDIPPGATLVFEVELLGIEP
ncbi:MAG: FKBP-type peptidyl-prolyl cis-trans isomerase [Pseudomonadales bacterium]|nr:FKBP-type peptidyl-prolyl cis-trans isomerase [Pseudomonadales bacterium]MCP5183126.1 FKBP-type peptidyl-prolyl cis-trans isomerase [Pseudomonadales bacterium]